jgi:hypothetical protein
VPGFASAAALISLWASSSSVDIGQFLLSVNRARSYALSAMAAPLQSASVKNKTTKKKKAITPIKIAVILVSFLKPDLTHYLFYVICLTKSSAKPCVNANFIVNS